MFDFFHTVAGGIAIAISSVALLFSGASVTHIDTVFPREGYYNGAGIVNPDPGHSMAFLSIRWTLPESGTGYANNPMIATCYKDETRCYIASRDPISDDQANLNPPPVLTITQWPDHIVDPIVATYGDNSDSCLKTTLNMYRSSDTAELIQEPINRSQTQCKDAENIIYRWTIEEPRQT